MPTNDTLTRNPDITHPHPRIDTNAIPASLETSQPQRPPMDVAHAGAGVAFAIAAAVAVGALVWAVVTGPTETSVDTSTHDRVELNRVDTLRDLATQPTSSTDRAELNRVDTLRDLATQPTGSTDRAELNRVDTLRDLGTQPTSR